MPWSGFKHRLMRYSAQAGSGNEAMLRSHVEAINAASQSGTVVEYVAWFQNHLDGAVYDEGDREQPNKILFMFIRMAFIRGLRDQTMRHEMELRNHANVAEMLKHAGDLDALLRHEETRRSGAVGGGGKQRKKEDGSAPVESKAKNNKSEQWYIKQLGRAEVDRRKTAGHCLHCDRDNHTTEECRHGAKDKEVTLAPREGKKA
jgi:hypothetical protein